MRTRNPAVRRRALWWQLAACALLLIGMMSQARESQARLDPFYIVKGQSYGSIVPRVLFVLDTSGSMGFEVPWPDRKCEWDECEREGDGQSRMFTARKVINEVVEHAGESATFGLMTFGMAKPPASADDLPYLCYSYDTGKWNRFVWGSWVNQPYGNVWRPLVNAFGGQGTWILCGDNRPFPYLRHDNLGGFSLPNNSVEELSDEPLYVQKSTHSRFQKSSNYSRGVQFFPRFIGRRANLDCDDPQERAIVLGSNGDYGTTDAKRLNKVCNRDFYYWPYVDGNAGYSYYSTYSYNDTWHVECNDYGNCSSTTSQVHRLGTNRRYYSDGATLYVPFYSKAVIDSNQVPIDKKGPLDEDDAEVMFNGLTSENHLGGIDLSGGTPWRVAIGNVDWQVKDTNNGLEPKSLTPKSNAAFSHKTVASYLAFLTTVADEDVCRPTIAILVTDGQPDPWSSQGGSELYSRLAKLRKRLGVKVYMVSFGEGAVNNPTAWERMHHIACAAAGANSTFAPCNGTNDYDWDTCRNSENPENECAWLATNSTELAEALSQIIDGVIESDIPAGAPTSANEFQSSDPNDPDADNAAVQTSISAWTQSPAWRGHVAREACTDEDPDHPGQVAEYCKNAATLPLESEELESFGPCPLGRVWDAGECLALTDPALRRLYTHNGDNELIRIAEEGAPSAEFRNLVLELDNQGLLDPPLSPGNENAEITAMVDLLLGATGPDDWKLPGLANSAPMLVRRVPEYNASFLPSVGIRDPHCAGRRNASSDNIPTSLEAFSSKAWQLSAGNGLNDHYDYTEAVLVGDDFGLLHAFHYDSGNELFAFLPRALVNNARRLSLGDPETFGQASNLDEHVYGIASTVNAGWAYDEEAQTWRHLAVFGFGPGGSEIVTLDVSHMGRLQTDEPVEIVWTSSTTEIAADYAATLGETWSRPTLTYAVPNHEMSVEPKAYLVFGSGYPKAQDGPENGHVVWLVDAITGEEVVNKAWVDPPVNGTSFDHAKLITTTSDIAVTSHCLSRYWGEMQEAYWADAGGRLYRWDLATDVSDPEDFPHAADSGGAWPVNEGGYALASPVMRFPACQGAGEFSCAVKPIGLGGNKGDVFTFGPALSAKNRIDPINNPGTILGVGDRDQVLVALVSGNPNDDATDGGDENNNFHSSIYLLVDDHREDPSGGFDIPTDAPMTAPGAHKHFMRLPLSAIERTRHVEYPDGSSEDETRVFSKKARPLKAPMLRVSGAADGTEQIDAEVYYVTYTIYEPGDSKCDPRWYDEDEKAWVADAGATYEVTFRFVAEGGKDFDFNNVFNLPGAPADGFGTAGGLSSPQVNQVGDCDDGNCGAALRAPRNNPCDPNVAAPPVGGVVSVSTGYSELQGFTPLELPL